MKTTGKRFPLILVLPGLAGLLAAAAMAADYTIDWYTVDGGGGTSTGGVYSASGTIGQPDAGTMSGGNYSVTGGFWSIAAVQTPGAPRLFLSFSPTNTVVLSWPLPDIGWQLQASANLSTSPIAWTDLAPPYRTNATSLYFVDPLPTGNKFYRLHRP
jgi:hypothetical protein